MTCNPDSKRLGIELLAQHLRDLEAERFIALIQREYMDYTQWRPQHLGIQDISVRAMSLRLN
jgi:hypothetical protein